MKKSEFKIRISKKFTIYIPKAIVEAAGVKEGDYLKISVNDSKIILEPIPDPFDIALKGPKFGKTTFEEFEKSSEEMQDELFG